MKRFSKNEDGFTGLEAAIVLIAFVVVAAVFSYVVLGAGFFTTQKSQETVHTSVTQASSALEVAGDVAALGAAGNVLDYVNFSLQNSAGGTGVDINKITYTVSTSDKMKDFISANSSVAPPAGVGLVSAEWLLGGLSTTSNHDGNEVLEKYEMVQIGIDLGDLSITEDEEFSIEIKPDIGAPIPLERTGPSAIANGEWYNLV
jgi:flagellin FlaB